MNLIRAPYLGQIAGGPDSWGEVEGSTRFAWESPIHGVQHPAEGAGNAERGLE